MSEGDVIVIKTSKKIQRLILSSIAALILTGCGSSSASAAVLTAAAINTPAATSSASAPAAEETAAAADESSSKILIMFFDQGMNSDGAGDADVDAITSASLSGGIPDGITANNIRVMKDEIASVTGGDTYAILINETYAPVYEDMVGQGQIDQDDDKQFTFRTELPDISQYDTIFFGTPVWWGHLPQPVVNVFEQMDFSGKTIIPFGIHLGSRFGSMLSQMSEMEPDAVISDNGLTVNAHTSNDEVRQDVDDWLNELGYQA